MFVGNRGGITDGSVGEALKGKKKVDCDGKRGGFYRSLFVR